jgi:hypothetical protein
MLEGLLGCDSLRGVVDENATEQVEELLVELVVWGYCVLVVVLVM